MKKIIPAKIIESCEYCPYMEWDDFESGACQYFCSLIKLNGPTGVPCHPFVKNKRGILPDCPLDDFDEGFISESESVGSLNNMIENTLKEACEQPAPAAGE